ncbi:MAG: hypothetical protein LBB56_09005 [Chitinispirillales bacterium]|jgi:signal transduction histidine kinase|nr:hypothetical protein [Chitinispirillales bacterium]
MLYLLIAAILAVVCLSFIIYRLKAGASEQNLKLKQAYKDLEQSKPMRDLGESAATLSHDIKNQMSVISGYASLLIRSKTIDDKSRKMADNILQASLRIQELSISALDAARVKAKRETEALDAAVVLDSTKDI